jgi:hypothetical protein
MTSNTQRIRNTAHDMILTGFCLEGQQLEAWLNSRAPLVLIDEEMSSAEITRFLQGIRRSTIGPSQLVVRRRIESLIEAFFGPDFR